MMDGFVVTTETIVSALSGGEQLFFINLLHHLHQDMSLLKARGALRISDDKIQKHFDEIPHDCTVIIYSNCQGDEPSIRAARLLQQNGWDDVHPLEGGFNAYLDAGLPVEEIDRGTSPTKTMLL